MENNINEEMSYLLNNLWISKTTQKEKYYKIKSKLTELREISGKLGCDIIANNKIIKLEKLPISIDSTFKIEAFDNKLDYVLYMCLLLFLQYKGLDEQFILSNFTDYTTNVLSSFEGTNKPDWTKYKDRKSLVDVLKYAEKVGIIRLRDGNDESFADNELSEALYENTTLSHYVVRNFKFNVFNCYAPSDFLEEEKKTIDEKDYKKIISYRGLFFYPHLYLPELTEDARNYIKNIRYSIGNDVSKFLDGELILAKDEALVSMPDNRNSELFPDLNKSITDIVLLVCAELNNQEVENLIPKEQFKLILENVFNEYKDYFSKLYRDLPTYKFDEEIMKYMESFKLIKITENYVQVYPICYFFEGYFKKEESVVNNFEYLTLDLEG